MPTILSIGSATQDIFLRSKKFEEVRDANAPDGFDACFPLGAKIGVDDIFYASGGGATNAAVTFARFGFKTTTLTRVGNDATGDAILNELKREHIDTRLIQKDEKEKTATSVILLAGTGHRAILTYRGAANHLQIPDTLPKTNWIYLTSLGKDQSALRRVFAHAKKTNALVAWNPGNAELSRGIKTLALFLQQTSVLILNREEAALLTGLPSRQLDRMIDEITHHVSRIIRSYSTTGYSTTRPPSHVLTITDGGRGAYVATQNQLLFAPALKAKRINTTGAGDAFGSAFVASLANGSDHATAMQVAMLNATGVITHMGAKAGILSHAPSKDELNTVTIKNI